MQQYQQHHRHLRVEGSDIPPRGSAHSAPNNAGSDQALQEYVSADVRSQAVARMREMNSKHAIAAWQRRRKDPIAPYGLAFLFGWPDPRRPSRWKIAAATRIWLAGPESADLARLLFTAGQHAAQLLAQGPYDMRQVLANRCDDMPADAIYVGIGLSSLDTHTGTWQQACKTASNEGDLPGQIMILLTDHTIMICQRRGLNEFNEFHLHSNHSLEIASGHSMYRWSSASSDQLRGDPQNEQPLTFLTALHETLCLADNTRLDSDSSRPSAMGDRR
jgi:hypothetical protein